MNESIEPAGIRVSGAELNDLQYRLAAARWPDASPVSDESRGIPEQKLASLAEYWRDGFDWRAREAELGEHLFSTVIDGQRIGFLHVRSEREDAVPLLLLHGFPSSIAEFGGMIAPLVAPKNDQAFHLVIPSLPGYGYSTPLSGAGWTMGRSAAAFAELMRRLGYDRYGVHGGDVGAGIAGSMAGIDGDHIIGLHVVTDPFTAASVATFLPGMAESLDDGDPVDQVILERMNRFRTDGSGYLAIQNSRPQTVGYGLTDSPVFQLAWIAEKVDAWTDLPVDRDQLLTTVSLYWFTKSGASAAHTLYDQAHSSDWGAPPAVPQGFSVFGSDATVRKLVPAPAGAFWREHERGLHFPAMESPTELAADLRDFFADLA
ncbi:epoxide hydrolase [Humibacter ginsengiterrae]